MAEACQCLRGAERNRSQQITLVLLAQRTDTVQSILQNGTGLFAIKQWVSLILQTF